MVEQIGAVIKHVFGMAKILRAGALDHIARQRKRAASKTDERNGIVQGAPYFGHRIEHIGQMLGRIGHK
ncbi:MAG: hypothetical protein BWY57_02956 [Betaproteobacteria bacterium ADurb.Bin341]|nr:MAG: hypothetical protein BWY57_02956 [Betaproteobacteria bacterium ADurb.Bin341]